MNPSISDASLEALHRRLQALEAAQAVRQVIARYMQLCDVPAGLERAEELQSLFTEDAVWEGMGRQYANTFGRLAGSSVIVAMLMTYLPPSSHFRFNGHFLTAESIQASGTTATGSWLMQQISSYESSDCELIVARLNIDFKAVMDGWRISHFRTERLAAFPLVAPRGTVR